MSWLNKAVKENILNVMSNNAKAISKLSALNLNLRRTTPKKHKIIVLSDHPLSTSGVGVQANLLIEGLLKTGKYSFRCLGGAIEHGSYDTIMVNGNPDYMIKPVNGFGDHNIMRQLMYTEKPDAILIFTDPRQFMWLWEIEDEVHELCPIVYWHVWDNDPYPSFNKVWYDSTDLIACLSYKTYDMVYPNFPNKTKYIPHTFPKSLYSELPEEEIKALRAKFLPGKEDWFVGLWVNRNATRKMPNDVLNSWKLFLDELQTTQGHKNALLVMHTDPFDREGPNIPATIDLLGLKDNVWISTNKLGTSEMNQVHNLADFTINISKAEGFGLSTLISMQVGRPIVANYTGGIIRQVEDYRDGSFHGVAVKPAARTLVGSQVVPFIYDDHVSHVDVAKAYLSLYEMGPEKRKELGQKAKAYVDHEFSYEKMIKDWDESLSETVENFQKNNKTKRNWTLTKLGAESTELALPPREVPQQPTPRQAQQVSEQPQAVEPKHAIRSPKKVK